MKKIILSFLGMGFILLLFQGKSFSYFEDKMYCQFSKNNIIISLQAKSSYACKAYIRYVEVDMKKVYRDILIIQEYIDKKKDIGYRKPIKDQKVALLNSLQSIRQNILSHMKVFEANLFQKSKTYFLDSIAPYQAGLKRSLSVFKSASDATSLTYVMLIEEELSVIESIASSATFEHMNMYMQRYVYLKQQIVGK